MCLAFDFASFATGLAAGALVGVLAGYLHETETIGELQERVRIAIVQFERISSETRGRINEKSTDAELRRQLSELQDEIKKLYRKRDR